ncbi:MAG: hypothetical protein DYG94_14290 [Leptolyngbya sp. PLA3]|nr:MAG: hypothetical protein EDM82_13300 [Cyanobacteria bacterium CYA]MCE7969897.1 hypothetical protein [Leptolyngbya sp. PL-A3]
MHFDWKPQPAGQAIVDELIGACVSDCAALADLSERMRHECGSKLSDWIDFIEMPVDGVFEARLLEAGFEPAEVEGEERAWEHRGAMFPTILAGDVGLRKIGIKVDSVADFAAAHVIPNARRIEGVPWGPVRLLHAYDGEGVEVIAIERHGSRGFVPGTDAHRTVRALHHFECLRRRERRLGRDEAKAFDWLETLIDRSIADVGVDATCDLFFYSEREFWQRRNTAARVQKARQDLLGLGWANHDHHTYRSSRAWFWRLVRVLEKLGFEKRERFYAGAEAGWGAQVLEQPTCRITVFADVDLSAEELAGDFAAEPLPERGELGTVGLWCALHGESMLTAGMHHLECQFDFDALRDQLAGHGVRMMDPFTNMPVLRQAFTQGERWRVDEDRVRLLRERGLITAAQADEFLTNGAVGSHLENLERHDGYKGFNQKGVSDIILRTDPRARAGA